VEQRDQLGHLGHRDPHGHDRADHRAAADRAEQQRVPSGSPRDEISVAAIAMPCR
jgi:hypothetical protein